MIDSGTLWGVVLLAYLIPAAWGIAEGHVIDALRDHDSLRKPADAQRFARRKSRHNLLMACWSLGLVALLGAYKLEMHPVVALLTLTLIALGVFAARLAVNFIIAHWKRNSSAGLPDNLEIIFMWSLGGWLLVSLYVPIFPNDDPHFWPTFAVAAIPLLLIAFTRRFWR